MRRVFAGCVTALYRISGLIAGIAGVLLPVRNVVGLPTAGQDTELNAIAAVVIGGASLFGATGSVFGTVVGIAIIGILQTGLVLADLSSYWQTLVTGAVIVVSVFAQQVINGEF